MKTNDTLLTIGIIGAAAFILYKARDLFSGVGNLGSSVLIPAGTVTGEVITESGEVAKSLLRSTKNITTYTERVTEIPSKVITAIQENVGKSQEQYIRSQPKVLNPAQGTRKNISLAVSTGKQTVPLIKQDVKTGKVTTTQIKPTVVLANIKRQIPSGGVGKKGASLRKS